MKRPIYLDNHATTPMDPRVFEVMLPYFQDDFGNASSSTHGFGWSARKAVEKARGQVADLIGARPDEIIFTSGATESNNWALLGALRPGDHVVSTAIEHPSVLSCLEILKSNGVECDLVAPDLSGMVCPKTIAALMRPNTKMISAMFANNEIGSILPVNEIGALAKEKGVLFHCDAVQAAGRILFSVDTLGVDFLSLSAHKVYGPKGVGALFVRRSKWDCLAPLVFGGGQERGLRAGTLNVPGIVGFGAACELAVAQTTQENQRIRGLKDDLWRRLKEGIPAIHLNGSMENRLSGNLNFSIDGIDGEAFLLAVQNEVAISASSACCSSGSRGSRVLAALGLTPDQIQSSFRIGIGRFNTQSDIEIAAQVLCLAQKSARC